MLHQVTLSGPEGLAQECGAPTPQAATHNFNPVFPQESSGVQPVVCELHRRRSDPISTAN